MSRQPPSHPSFVVVKFSVSFSISSISVSLFSYARPSVLVCFAASYFSVTIIYIHIHTSIFSFLSVVCGAPFLSVLFPWSVRYRTHSYLVHISFRDRRVPIRRRRRSEAEMQSRARWFLFSSSTNAFFIPSYLCTHMGTVRINGGFAFRACVVQSAQG